MPLEPLKLGPERASICGLCLAVESHLSVILITNVEVPFFQLRRALRKYNRRSCNVQVELDIALDETAGLDRWTRRRLLLQVVRNIHAEFLVRDSFGVAIQTFHEMNVVRALG
jgi:hypothetical protein